MLCTGVADGVVAGPQLASRIIRVEKYMEYDAFIKSPEKLESVVIHPICFNSHHVTDKRVECITAKITRQPFESKYQSGL